MADGITWLGVVCVLAIFEMATGTFYLLMIAIGAAAGGIAAWSGVSGVWQCVIAAAVAAGAATALRRSRFGRTKKIDAARDPGINLDIGQTLQINEWHQGAPGTAREMYRGALWDVELAAGGTPVPGRFVIQQLQGNRLIVINSGAGDLEPADHTQ